MPPRNIGQPQEQETARLLSLASHELRTPLSVLGGYLRMLQQHSDPPLGELSTKMIMEAQKSCERLAALTRELSDLAKLDTGDTAFAHDPIDLFQLLAQVPATIEDAADRGVSLQLRGQETGAPLKGDAARLTTAFHSLFRAVVREQAASCTVIVDRRLQETTEGMRAVTIVADERQLPIASAAGAGPFNEFRGGLGLLLPLARRIVEHHGGRVWSPAARDASSAIVVSLPVNAGG